MDSKINFLPMDSKINFFFWGVGGKFEKCKDLVGLCFLSWKCPSLPNFTYESVVLIRNQPELIKNKLKSK